MLLSLPLPLHACTHTNPSVSDLDQSPFKPINSTCSTLIHARCSLSSAEQHVVSTFPPSCFRDRGRLFTLRFSLFQRMSVCQWWCQWEGCVFHPQTKPESRLCLRSVLQTLPLSCEVWPGGKRFQCLYFPFQQVSVRRKKGNGNRARIMRARGRSMGWGRKCIS